MKDVLLIADLHGQFGKIDSFLELNPEAVFIAGDITNMGPVDAVDDVLSRIDVPCFAVPGNCDPREILETLEHSDTVCTARFPDQPGEDVNCRCRRLKPHTVQHTV